LSGAIAGQILSWPTNLRLPDRNANQLIFIAYRLGVHFMADSTMTPSTILRRLSAYPRQNALAKALREIDRLERALFMLDWISDPALRQRTNAGLNKGGARKLTGR
jgi:TnpA family transposase